MVLCHSRLNWLRQFLSRNCSIFQWLTENFIIWRMLYRLTDSKTSWSEPPLPSGIPIEIISGKIAPISAVSVIPESKRETHLGSEWIMTNMGDLTTQKWFLCIVEVAKERERREVCFILRPESRRHHLYTPTDLTGPDSTRAINKGFLACHMHV